MEHGIVVILTALIITAAVTIHRCHSLLWDNTDIVDCGVLQQINLGDDDHRAVSPGVTWISMKNTRQTRCRENDQSFTYYPNHIGEDMFILSSCEDGEVLLHMLHTGNSRNFHCQWLQKSSCSGVPQENFTSLSALPAAMSPPFTEGSQEQFCHHLASPDDHVEYFIKVTSDKSITVYEVFLRKRDIEHIWNDAFRDLPELPLRYHLVRCDMQ